MTHFDSESQKLNVFKTTLIKLLGSRVLIRMRKNTLFSGILKSIDEHVNIVLAQASEVQDDGSIIINYGALFIRGNQISLVSHDKSISF